MSKQKTDEEITDWLDGLDRAQIKLWATAKPKLATDLPGIARASGMKLGTLRNEAANLLFGEQEYADFILDRITSNPLFARHREMAEERLEQLLLQDWADAQTPEELRMWSSEVVATATTLQEVASATGCALADLQESCHSSKLSEEDYLADLRRYREMPHNEAVIEAAARRLAELGRFRKSDRKSFPVNVRINERADFETTADAAAWIVEQMVSKWDRLGITDRIYIMWHYKEGRTPDALVQAVIEHAFAVDIAALRDQGSFVSPDSPEDRFPVPATQLFSFFDYLRTYGVDGSADWVDNYDSLLNRLGLPDRRGFFREAFDLEGEELRSWIRENAHRAPIKHTWVEKVRA